MSTSSKATEFKINHPPTFDGDRDKSKSFMLSCNAYIDINSEIYKTDTQKVIFISSFMNEGNVRSWKEEFLADAQFIDSTGQKKGYGTLKEFNESFEKAFGPIDPAGTVLARLLELRQGPEGLQTYIADFQRLLAQAKIKEEHMKIYHFENSLNGGLLTKMFNAGGVPKNLDDYITAVVDLDNCYARLQARRNRLPSRQIQKKNSRGDQRFIPTRDRDAMVIDQITNEAKQEYMRTGKCFNCHQIGHRARECPQKKKTPYPAVRKVEEEEEARRIDEDF
jgi:Retrotransposon gag protein/Zinc knuckle